VPRDTKIYNTIKTTIGERGEKPLKPKIPPLFLIILITITCVVTLTPAQASPTPALTVTTDKPAYYPKENVTTYGNLTQDGAPVPDGLVAIEVKDPKDQTLVIRTTTTGDAPPETPYVKVRSVIPCDSTGGPKDSFKRGLQAWFNLTITNYDIQPRNVCLTVNIYDSSGTPRGYDSILVPNMAGPSTSYAILCVLIPEEAALGNATVYGNVYTRWPSLGGWPYCTEESSTFLITNGGSSSFTTTTALKQKTEFSTTMQFNGNYNNTFKLPPRAAAGNYIIYVTTRYLGEEASSNTTFKVILIADFDGDGDVDGWDGIYFVDAYVDYWTPPVGEVTDPDYWRCDLDGDGDVDGWDGIAFVDAFVEYWI